MSNKVKQQASDEDLVQLVVGGLATHAVQAGLVDPDPDQDVEPDEDAATARTDAPADEDQQPIQIDQQMFQQAIANKNARLIAVLVNETAMLEVALETERRSSNELRAQLRAAEAALASLSE